MNQQIAELAKQMNVSYGDVLSLALGVIQGMENDKVAEVFLANEEERVLMAQVYGTAHVAKSNRIMVDYLTKPEYARELQNFVRVSLEVEAA